MTSAASRREAKPSGRSPALRSPSTDAPASRSSPLLAAAVLGEEGLEGGPDVFLPLDQDGLEVVCVEAAEDVQHRALVVARAERLDLAVAEEVAHLGQLLGRAERSRIVRVEVVAVRAVEGVDVPQRRVVARLDDLERLHVARRE